MPADPPAHPLAAPDGEVDDLPEAHLYLPQAVSKLRKALARFLEVYEEAEVTGCTEFERRASEGEIADRAAEVLHGELSDFGYVEIESVLAALAAPQASVAALRVALHPFASAYGDDLNGYEDDIGIGSRGLTVGAFRKARAALAATSTAESERALDAHADTTASPPSTWPEAGAAEDVA